MPIVAATRRQASRLRMGRDDFPRLARNRSPAGRGRFSHCGEIHRRDRDGGGVCRLGSDRQRRDRLVGEMMRCGQLVFFGLIWLALIDASRAGEISIALPLRAYSRIGKYVPVRITADSSRLHVEGDGIVPLDIDTAGGAIDAVFPVLIVGPVTAITVRDDA